MIITLSRIIFVLSIFVLCNPVIQGQSSLESESPMIFEIVHTVCKGECEHETTKVFADGRFVSEELGLEAAKSKRSRKLFITIKKQLEKEELLELVELAEQPAFLNAQREYVNHVREYPDWFTVSYRNKGREKTIRVFNFSRSSEVERGKVPAPLVLLMKWADPYSFSYLSK